MKLRPVHLLLLLLSVCGGIRAQSPSEADDASAQAQASGLTSQERGRLKVAHDTALKDPAVRAAKARNDSDALQQAVRDAMVRHDPSVEPLLKKIEANRANAGENGAKNNLYSFLSLGERGQLRKAHSAAGKDPAVAAARKQFDAASTPEAKRKAEDNLREAMRKAMLRADPGVAPLLEKIRQHKPEAEDAE
jgi:hypothetical protein